MRIDPKVEKPTRTMLGHAIRGELDELATVIQAAGNETYLGSIALCLAVAGYIAIDVCRMQWPGDADLREIARHTAETTTKFDLSASDIHDYLARAVLSFERLDQVFPSVESAVTLPVLITGRVLISFCPSDKEWWEYLDLIWNAVNAAAGIDLSVLPALMLRARRPPVAETRT
jgi:hypothetical protein